MAFVVVWLFFGYFDRRETSNSKPMYPVAEGQGLRLPPGPRLQTSPRTDLQEFRAREDALLDSYQWVDKSAGHRPNSDHRGDEDGGSARTAGTRSEAMKEASSVSPVSPVVALLVAAASLAIAAVPAAAQMTGHPAAGYKRTPGMPASTMPRRCARIGFDQNLNQQVPLDVRFTDEHGRAVTLGDYFGRRPVVLAFVYFECPMLCTQVLSAMTSSLNLLSIDAGKDFDVVAVSFDPRETPRQAPARKALTLERYDRPDAAAGWHFLTGDQEAIDRID